MAMQLTANITNALRAVIANPSLEGARALENALVALFEKAGVWPNQPKGLNRGGIRKRSRYHRTIGQRVRYVFDSRAVSYWHSAK